MGVHQKLIAFLFQASLVFILFSIVSSSQGHKEIISSHSNNKDNHIKMNPKLQYQITLHGFLLWASMGFLMPVGILAIRLLNREGNPRRQRIIFYVHAILQVSSFLYIIIGIQPVKRKTNYAVGCGTNQVSSQVKMKMLAVLLATAGAIMSIKNFNNLFNNNHQRLGVALYGIIWLQVLVGIFRPQRGSKRRSVWFFAHWIIGIAVSFLGVLNVYIGLGAYQEKTSKGIRIWNILFTIQISLIVFFYLFQEKWVYIQNQRVTLGNELMAPTCQEIRPEHKEKVLKAEPC